MKKDFLLSDDNDFKKNNDEDDDKKDKISAGVNHHEELEEADAEMTVFVKAWCNFGKRRSSGPLEQMLPFYDRVLDELDKINVSKYGGNVTSKEDDDGFKDCNSKFISSLDKLSRPANLSSVVPSIDDA